MGKTTIASKFEKPLLVAFEIGYNALPGVMVQPITTWSDFRKVLRQLKNPAVKEKFSTIIIDTADIAWDAAEKYICSNAKRSDGGTGVDSISDIPYGKGFGLVSKEFDECMRSIMQMQYGLVLISHSTDKTLKNQNGEDYLKIVPTLPNRAKTIVARMSDLYGYVGMSVDENGKSVPLLYLRETPRYEAGSRFKYIQDVVELEYSALVAAVKRAIDMEKAEVGSSFYTKERTNNYAESTLNKLDYDELMGQFEDLIQKIFANHAEPDDSRKMADKVQFIVEKYLGKGNKVSECDRNQVEALDLIVTDLKELA